jgi:outer membrane protein OmpA-like peptidoglycan-associated protein
MKNKILLLMAFAIASQFMKAQTADYKFAIGLNVLRNEYNGDYGNGIFNFTQVMNPGVGLSLAYYLNPSFDLGLQSSYGMYGFYESDANRFTGMKFDMSVYTHYKFNNGYFLKKDSRLSPFLSLGVGFATYGINSQVDKSGSDPSLYPTIITKGVDLIIPVGAGLKYQITQAFAIQYQYLYNITNSDIHDQNRTGIVNNFFGTPAHPYSMAGNDAYGQHVFSLIFNFGKLKDTDKDGIADKYDKCPDTPFGVKVDANGCPIDSDGDGVADYMDKCPNTPTGVQVDAAGCPIDSDGDGVPDYLDKCSNTPAGVKVDLSGCPIDSDVDGVPDYLDKCPNTPAGVKVDMNGCPLDSDGDGVPDYLDKCPGTPAVAYGKVDASGCPIDTDGDGIPDYLDQCPTIPGTVANHGCPEVKKEVKALFQKALQGIQFQTGKANIKPFSYPLLNQIANILILNPTYLIEVQGHTDNVGGYDYNITLSDKRAASVRAYLISKGVSETKITSKGYGYNKPVASNDTKSGKATNRRVEFVVTFEK